MCRNKRLLLLVIFALFAPLAVSPDAAEVLPSDEIRESRYSYETVEAVYGSFPVSMKFGRTSFLKRESRILHSGADMIVTEVRKESSDEVAENEVLLVLMPLQDELETAKKERSLERKREAYLRRRTEIDREIAAAEKMMNETADAALRELQSLELQKTQVLYQQYVFTEEHEIARLQAEIDALKTAVEIVSPIDGIVGKIHVKSGSVVKDGDTLAEISGKPAPILRIQQNENERIARAHYGQKLHFPSGKEGTGEEAEGFLAASSKIPEMSVADRTDGWSIAVLPDLSPELLAEIEGGTLPGRLFSEVRLEERFVENVLMIPKEAVRSEETTGLRTVYYVRVLNEDGQVNRRNIQILEEDAEYVWVISGLEAGEKVVVKERSS